MPVFDDYSIYSGKDHLSPLLRSSLFRPGSKIKQALKKPGAVKIDEKEARKVATSLVDRYVQMKRDGVEPDPMMTRLFSEITKLYNKGK